MATEKQKALLKKINDEIKEVRKQVYAENMGITTFMYPTLPSYQTINDIVRDFPEDKDYNIILTNAYGSWGFESIEDMIISLKMNVYKQTLVDLCDNHIFQGFHVIMSPEIEKTIKEYIRKFD